MKRLHARLQSIEERIHPATCRTCFNSPHRTEFIDPDDVTETPWHTTFPDECPTCGRPVFSVIRIMHPLDEGARDAWLERAG